MLGRDGDDDARVADAQASDRMHHREPVQGPSRPRLLDDRADRLDRHLLIRRVVDLGDGHAFVGLADDADEHADPAGCRRADEADRLGGIERARPDLDDVVLSAGDGRQQRDLVAVGKRGPEIDDVGVERDPRGRPVALQPRRARVRTSSTSPRARRDRALGRLR